MKNLLRVSLMFLDRLFPWASQRRLFKNSRAHQRRTILMRCAFWENAMKKDDLSSKMPTRPLLRLKNPQKLQKKEFP